jgi:putative FmdB family regulatory protein
MPIYEYYCDSCDYTEEQIVPYAERDNMPICVDCMLPMFRLPSNVAKPKFVGKGFYETDYVKRKK